MDLSSIVERIAALPHTQARRIIAVAGAPGSGKSTLAEALAARIEGAKVVPMDGFHLDNDVLAARDILHRKGAPETFDVAAFAAKMSELRRADDVSYPTFDRARDRVVPQGGRVVAANHTLLVEGNYLLLDTGAWRGLREIWDLTVMIDVPLTVLRARLVARWLDHGLSPDAALARAQGNDLPNAQYVIAHSRTADLPVGIASLS